MSNENYLKKLFIDEAKPALQRHSGGGGSAKVQPLEIAGRGVYDATIPTELSWGKEVTLKNNISDEDLAKIESALRELNVIDDESDSNVTVLLGVLPEPNGALCYIDFIHVPSEGILLPSVRYIPNVAESQSYSCTYVTLKAAEALGSPESFVCKWINELDMSPVGDALYFGLPEKSAYERGVLEKQFHPLPFDILQLLFNEPIYEKSQFVGYNPVTLKSATLKELFSKTKNLGNMFCNLSDVSLLQYDDTEDATHLHYAFYNNQNVVEAPRLNTKKVVSMGWMFNLCKNLEVIPDYDCRSCGSLLGFIEGAPKVREIWITNIDTNVVLGDADGAGSQLTEESLLHIIKELLVQTNKTRELTVNVSQAMLIDSLCVRLIEITDEMRADDDLIDRKMPFELCSPEDDGAMSMSIYLQLKGWGYDAAIT